MAVSYCAQHAMDFSSLRAVRTSIWLPTSPTLANRRTRVRTLPRRGCIDRLRSLSLFSAAPIVLKECSPFRSKKPPGAWNYGPGCQGRPRAGRANIAANASSQPSISATKKKSLQRYAHLFNSPTGDGLRAYWAKKRDWISLSRWQRRGTKEPLLREVRRRLPRLRISVAESGFRDGMPVIAVYRPDRRGPAYFIRLNGTGPPHANSRLLFRAPTSRRRRVLKSVPSISMGVQANRLSSLVSWLVKPSSHLVNSSAVHRVEHDHADPVAGRSEVNGDVCSRRPRPREKVVTFVSRGANAA